MGQLQRVDFGDVADRSVDKKDTWLLSNPNRMKLGVFGPNVSGGMSPMTVAPGPPTIARWDENRAVAVMADRAGIEAIIPVAKWKGVEGVSRFWERTYETFTWAAAVAEATSRIHIFVTAHVPVYHPVMAAKMVATVDHISNGRVALNTVTGIWEPEFAQFGIFELPEHDRRYEHATEWLSIVKRLWEADEPIDVESENFHFTGAFSSPKPVQRPHPVLMNAGWSPAGQAFTAEHSDLLFVNLGWNEEAPKRIAGTRERLDQSGRPIGIWAMAHIVCRDSEQEAREAISHYADELGDWESAAALLATVSRTAHSMPGVHEGMVEAESDADRNAALRANTSLRNLVEHCRASPLVGTPEQVVEGMLEMANGGIDGLALQFLDYGDELGTFVERVMPLMVEAGLREEDSPDR